MGEGQNPLEMAAVLRIVRARGLKACLYSGSDSVTPFQPILPLLDFIKLGAYHEALGGLDS